LILEFPRSSLVSFSLASKVSSAVYIMVQTVSKINYELLSTGNEKKKIQTGFSALDFFTVVLESLVILCELPSVISTRN
jgi:hypothetical protein